MAVAPLEIDLPRSREAPKLARRVFTDWIGDALEANDVDRARLLVSELVTNAIMHCRGAITLRAGVAEDRLLVEVMDEGAGFEHQIRAREFHRVGGNGLRLVDIEASRRGVHEGSTHVWFELEPSGPRLGAAENPLT